MQRDGSNSPGRNTGVGKCIMSQLDNEILRELIDDIWRLGALGHRADVEASAVIVEVVNGGTVLR